MVRKLEVKVDWNVEQQELFDELRARQLAGMLTAEEQSRLDELIALLEAEEACYLSSAIDRMRAEQAALREQLETLQTENESLAWLVSQQEQLTADARRWLAQFEQRHRQIQQAYARLTGQTLAAGGVVGRAVGARQNL